MNVVKRKEQVGRIKLIDEQIEKEKKIQFRKKIGKVVDKLRSSRGINGPDMWEVMKQLKRRNNTPPSAIKNKKGEILEEPDKIKERYLEHFVELLQPPDATTDQGRNQEELINLVFEQIMEMAEKEPTMLTTESEIAEAKKELKRKKCKDGNGWNNEILLDGGEEMDKSLLKLFNRIEVDRKLPDDWKEVIIKTMNKPGTVLDMDNKRGLFITDVLSKLYEKVMKKRNDEPVTSYISPFQSGGVKGRATVDNHIILSEIIRKNRKLGRKTYVVFGDAVKCFDKLWLRDALVEMYKAGCNLQDIQMMYRMNEDTGIVVETPLGNTERVKVGEIVKQGTVLGPQLCCVETDQINKIGENQEKLVGEEMVGILIFVDDVMSAGTAEEIRKAIRNFGEMETLKKFTYGLKKTNYMIIETGREKDEEINEKVKLGSVLEVDEYNYIGLWLNKKGNCSLQIEKKKGKIKGKISALKSLASYQNVGSLFVKVRLQLYILCILPGVLYNLEGWNDLTKAEIKQLESIQHQALCSLLHLPKTTPYLGLLSELGMWRMEEWVMYRKTMLYHNIINSREDRLCRKVIEQQQNVQDEDTFYNVTKRYFEQLGMDITAARSMPKSELKRKLKTGLNSRTSNAITASLHKTKMRFIAASDNLETSKYMDNLTGSEALKALKTRLNMQPVYGNYKGDISKPRLCQFCMEEDDTTEHLLSCKVLETSLCADHLSNEEDAELWIQINELVDFNLDHRI